MQFAERYLNQVVRIAGGLDLATVRQSGAPNGVSS